MVCRYLLTEVLRKMTYGELVAWGAENASSTECLALAMLKTETLGDELRAVIQGLDLDHMRKRDMFLRWPDAFSDEIKLNMHGEPSWPPRASGD